MAKPKARRGARARPWHERLRERLRLLTPTRAWLDPWLCGLACVWLLIAAAHYVWLGALLAELRFQLAWLAVLATAWALWRRAWARAASLLLGAIWLAAPAFPYVRAARPTPQHGPALELVQQHLDDAPLTAGTLQRFLHSRRPQLLSLTGVRGADLAALTKATPGYRRLSSAPDALLLAQAELVTGFSTKPGQLRVGACTLGVTQLGLPSLFRALEQPARAAAIAALVKTQLAPRQVWIGHLGSSVAAVDLRETLESRALRDARLGHGLLATAPAALPWLGLPVDHVLVRGWLLVRDAQTEAALVPGAHRTLAVTLELTEPRCAPGSKPR